MKVGIANDHHGVEVKKELIEKLTSMGYDMVDFGTNESEMVDYPLYAFKVGEAVRDNKIDFGILLCNSGIGMSIACNKVKGVRCAKVGSNWDAEMTRRDNDANVIALSTRNSIDELVSMINTFLTTEFKQIDRYIRRVEQIDNYKND